MFGTHPTACGLLGMMLSGQCFDDSTASTHARYRERERGGGEEGGGDSKTLFYKDCSLGSVKPCLTTSY